MPKVVIELQANTQDAVTKIQQFARAQKDAFDAIKVGNTTLAEATVKVSKLTESTAGAAKGAQAANVAFRSLASQGIGQLASEIPGVGGALSALAHTLGTFPLLIGGIVGAGIGLIKMLQSWRDEADKTLASMEKLARDVQSKFQQSVLEVQKIRAQAAGDEGKAIVLAAEQALRIAEDVKQDRIAKAKGAQAEILAAEAEFQGKRMVIEAQGMADLDKLGQEQLAKRKKALEDETKAVAEAAEKQKQLVTDLVAANLRTFTALGAGFEDVVKSLELAQFVEKTQAQIAKLNEGIAAGIDTHGRFAAGVQVLQEKMAEAIRLGYVPTIEKAKELATAIEKTGESAVSVGERWRQSIEGISSALDDVIAQSRAAGDLGSGLRKFNPDYNLIPPEHSTITGGGMGTAVNQYPGGSYTGPEAIARTIAMIGGEFQHGGIVPGSGPIPIMAHGGERIIPAGGDGGGGARVVRIEPGAIQISGTVIDQSRDWAVLVESLGQALAARLR